MNMQEIILRMYPMWILGIFMIAMVWQSEYRYLLKVDKKAVLKWSAFLVVLTICRFLMFKFVLPHGTMDNESVTIPWQAALTVFWEDMCHGLPLVLLSNFLDKSKWYNRALQRMAFALIMVSFGLGHLYQGITAAVILSFYIPYSIHMGKKYGFGTVMLGHMLYDLSTILAIKYFVG